MVLAHYKSRGRHDLPWRKTRDPYKILVSEIMLQQTQATRVVPKYVAFIKQFPTAKSLARVPLSKVLTLWSGLGYNRRAKYLHQAAKQFQTDRLEDLPGVGPYTASAVRVFAFNKPEILIETNVRTVFLHHMFPRSKKVSDARLLPYVGVPRGVEPREWYSALMDYGTYLKSIHPNPSRRSQHHSKQSAFKGSEREVRGAVLRALVKGESVRSLPFAKERINRNLQALLAEGLVQKHGKKFILSP